MGVTQGSSARRERLRVPPANRDLFQPLRGATATSPTSRTGTSPPQTPPTTWAPRWSSPVTLGTPWSRAPLSSSASTCGIPTGTTRSRCAEVSAAPGQCCPWGQQPWPALSLACLYSHVWRGADCRGRGDPVPQLAGALHGGGGLHLEDPRGRGEATLPGHPAVSSPGAQCLSLLILLQCPAPLTSSMESQNLRAVWVGGTLKLISHGQGHLPLLQVPSSPALDTLSDGAATA